jgi:hypothetical protein
MIRGSSQESRRRVGRSGEELAERCAQKSGAERKANGAAPRTLDEEDEPDGKGKVRMRVAIRDREWRIGKENWQRLSVSAYITGEHSYPIAR